jgi:hypothetical protein
LESGFLVVAELAGGMQAGRRGYCCFFEFFPKL